jgi:MFS family permease
MESIKKKTELGAFVPGLLPLFVLAHFGHHLLTALPIPLSPMIRSDFSLDYTSTGLVISVFNLSYGIGQLPGGWLADRFGPRIMMTVGICGVALAGFFVGLSQNFWMMMIFLAVMGVMGGGYHPAAPAMISASVERRRQGRALGLHVIGGSASFFLAPMIAAVIASYWGWRGSFITLSVFTMAFGIFFYAVLRRRAAAEEARRKSVTRPQESPVESFRWRHLVIFISMSSFAGAIIFSANSFLPLYLVDRVGFSKETAGAFFALLYSGGLWAGPIGGYLSDRFGPIPVVLTVLFLAGPVVYLFQFVSSWLGAAILLLMIGMIIYVRMPVSEAYIVNKTPEHNRSAILGIYYFSHMEGGGVLTPVMGYMIDRLGFSLSFTLAGVALVSVTLVGSLLLRTRK